MDFAGNVILTDDDAYGNGNKDGGCSCRVGGVCVCFLMIAIMIPVLRSGNGNDNNNCI